MELAHGIGPALPQQLPVGGHRFRLAQSVVPHRRGIPDVVIIGDDVVIAGQHHGQAGFQQPSSVDAQPLHPGQFVIELGARLRVAVWKVDARHPHAHHIGFEIAGLFVRLITRQAALHFCGGFAAEDGDAVEALLAVDKAVVARLAQRLDGEILRHHLDFLQAGDVGLGLLQPFQQAWQAGVGAVDVEGGDEHG